MQVPVLAKRPFSTLNLLYRFTADPNCLPEPSASLAHLLPPAAGHPRSTCAGAGAEVSSSHQPLLHGGDGLGQQLVHGRRRSPIRRRSSPPRGQLRSLPTRPAWRGRRHSPARRRSGLSADGKPRAAVSPHPPAAELAHTASAAWPAALAHTPAEHALAAGGARRRSRLGVARNASLHAADRALPRSRPPASRAAPTYGRGWPNSLQQSSIPPCGTSIQSQQMSI